MSKFTAAVKRAKKMYKTGRYKTFAAAVKAAYHKGVGSKPRAKRKVTRARRRVTKKRVAGVRSFARSAVKSFKQGFYSPRERAKKELAAACLAYELADTIKATKAAQKRKVAARKRLKSLSK